MRRIHLLMLAVLLVVGFLVPSATSAQGSLCFNVPGITNCIEGRFLEYWQQNGGLPVFGYPISAAVQQNNGEGTFLTQYFERNRFEYHGDKARPYDVLLGRLGDDRLKQQGRDWNTFPKAVPTAAHYYSATGHAIAQVFWNYWSTHGLSFDGKAGTSEAESLALWGYPLSEPMMETNSSGDTVMTQWFERARFEDHGAQGVLLGLLGSETTQGGSTPPPTQPTPTPPPTQPTPTPQPNDPCAGIGAPHLAEIQPNCVKEGGQIRVLVYGFKPNTQIGFWITKAGDGTIGTTQTVQVDADGEYGVRIDTTDFLPPGNYVFVAQDAAQELEPSTAPFRVIP